MEQPKGVADVTVLGRGRGLRWSGRNVVSVVIVKNEDRVAIRIVAAGVAPVERTAADDQCQQCREHSAHGSSLTRAKPHG